MSQPFSFEDKIDVIDNEIRKSRRRWYLSSITHMDYDDVAQILRMHICKKWHMWDQTQPLEPWISRIIINQISNLVRNNYGSFAKPCGRCPFNEGGSIEDDDCGFTTTKKQSAECPVFAKWIKSKRQAYNVKIPSSFDAHDFEISNTEADGSDMELAAQKLHQHMKSRLSPKQYRAYDLLMMRDLTDDEVAKELGFKTNEQGRYRQIQNLKKGFKELARKILDEEDILT